MLSRRANAAMTSPTVLAVSRDGEHRFSKPSAESITLLAGLGVEGDAHLGATVQHLSRKERHPDEPNLRQVHLMHAELFDELREHGFDLVPGVMGENITTSGLDILGLPRGTVLRLGSEAVIEVTGLRNPCEQLNGVQRGLMKAVLPRDEQGNVVRKAGIMSVVLVGGTVRPGDPIVVELPGGPHVPLAPV
jgi:MOSC domain-containing protein YiiM